MFISKVSLPRRTFLRGVGAALALPFLDAMVPASVSANAATAARRLGFVYIPHGVINDQWIPPAAGPIEFLPITRPLEAFRESLVLVGNLDRARAASNHAVAAGAWLTGVAPKRTDGPDFRDGTSMDQLVARHIGQDTTFPSLEVATEDFTGLLGACDPGYSCAYMNTLCWEGPTTPLPMEINPRAVFDRMFGGGGTPEERVTRLRTNRSILDLVRDDLADIERGLGPGDRVRLDEYSQHIREVERRIQRAERQNETDLTVPAAPVGVPDSYEEHVALMFELMALAYRADLTRVFTFMMAHEVSQRTYPQVGVTEPHHAVSHHTYKPDKMALHAKINTYHVSLFAKFLDRLRSTPDGDGSLLDHSLIVYGSGMSDGNVHSPYPLPFAMVGGGLKGDRYMVAGEHTPMANMLLTIADRFGLPLDSFGESTGRIALDA